MGQPITVTQIINNPTLIPNQGHGGSSAFFQNKAAVAGVFVVVGLAATALVFFLLFCFRRRRRNRIRDHDTAIAATLAEHGFGRQELIDPDDVRPASDPRTTTTPTGSGGSSDTRRTSSPSMSLSGINPGPVSAVGFGRQPPGTQHYADNFGQMSYNPYSTHNPYDPYMDSQVPYRHANPGPSNPGRMQNFSLPNVPGVGLPFFNHGPKESMGSTEPLLGAISDNDVPPEPAIPAVPPRNPRRLMEPAGDTYGDTGRSGSGGRPNDEKSSYRDDDRTEYGGVKRGSLRVRNIPD